jgi:hypothetical protein
VPRDGSLEIFNHKMHATYKLETPAACALVGYIYETKVRLHAFFGYFTTIISSFHFKFLSTACCRNKRSERY